jgi:hypothetical protein
VELRTGAPWRDLPERYGPWKTAHERLRRWTADVTWDRLLDEIVVKDKAVGNVEWVLSIDSSAVRAHQHAAGARKRELAMRAGRPLVVDGEAPRPLNRRADQQDPPRRRRTRVADVDRHHPPAKPATTRNCWHCSSNSTCDAPVLDDLVGDLTESSPIVPPHTLPGHVAGVAELSIGAAYGIADGGACSDQPLRNHALLCPCTKRNKAVAFNQARRPQLEPRRYLKG